MGRHADAGRRRGIARWVITAVVVVIVLAVITVGYFVIVNRTDSATDGVCSGRVTLHVAAGPDAQPALAEAAKDFNATKPVARTSCVTTAVTAVADHVALAGLAGDWPSDAGGAPGMWVPDSSASLTALDAARPDVAAGHPTDAFAWSPVVLAVDADDVPAVSSLAWSDLPTAAGPSGTAAMTGGRHLLLALPPIASNPATGYALQSMLAGAGRSEPLTRADVTAGADALTTVGQGAAADAADTARALADLAGGQGTATAVPVTESALVHFDATGKHLAAVHPHGATVGDALIAAPVTASWTNRTVAAAASAFQAYLSTPPAQQVFADHGWRTDAAHPKDPVAGVDTTTTVKRLTDAGPEVTAAIADALGQPAPSLPSSVVTSGGAASSGTSSAETGSSTAPTSTSASPTTTSPTTTSPTATSPTTGSSTVTSPTTSTSTSTTRSTTSANPAASGPVLTVIVDASDAMAATQDGKSLLDWAKAAVGSVTDGSVTDRAGLWAFADSGSLPPNGYPELVSTGPLGSKVDGKARSSALKSALAALKADGDRWAYGALIEALTKVPDAGVTGRENRVVLITSGVDQTPATPRQSVLDAEDAVGSKVRVDVIGLGSAVPVDAYQEIAKAGGGEYVPVTDPRKLATTLTDLLTLDH